MSKFIVTLLLAALSCNVFAVEKKHAPNTTKQAHIKNIVANNAHTFMQDYDVPGLTIQLYVHGKPHSYYFGVASKKTKKPVSARTIFELGSLTKLFSALLLAEEVDSAKVQLDESILTVLPSLPDDYEDMSFLNLATHTSGLPFLPPSDVNTGKKLFKYLKHTVPPQSPEESWQYSNFGLRVLNLTMEKVEHRDINTLFRQRIFNRLRMQPIGMHPDKGYRHLYAQGYDEQGEPVPVQQYSQVSARAMGVDMLRFLHAAIGLPGTPERILYPMRMTESPYVKLPDFSQGLGWEVHPIHDDANLSDLLNVTDSENLLQPREILEVEDKPIFDKHDLIDKTGQTEGFRAYIAVIPAKNTGIVVLANKVVPGKPIVKLARKILFAVNHLAPETPNTSS